MDVNMIDAFFGVYSSSREIIKNEQRHLYCRMLDLLRVTSKKVGTVSTKLSKDQLVNFWLSDILPLIFDKDAAIQCSAIAAIEQGLLTLDVNTIHNSSHWPQMRNDIITIYVPRINKLREDNNEYWHRIWCLLIRVFDREILKGAGTINNFLSIVELAFRSSDHTVRAGAFLCWRSLILIFFSYNELISPKRMKLLCIPLKSSQSKTAQSAVVKLQVWWYLLTCLNEKLGQFFHNLVEPFLVFCLGSSPRFNINSSPFYEEQLKLALPCVAALLSTKSNEFIQRILQEHKLEALSQPSPVMESSNFKKNWLPLINAGIAAIRVIDSPTMFNSDEDQQLLHVILSSVLRPMLHLDLAPLTVHVCTELAAMVSEHSFVVISAFDVISTDNILPNISINDMDSFTNVMNAFTQLFIAAKDIISHDVLEICINRVFMLDALCDANNQGHIAGALYSLLNSHNEISGALKVNLLVWYRVSCNLLKACKRDSEDLLKENIDVIDRYILWLIRLCRSTTEDNTSFFDKRFCLIWRQLLSFRMHFEGTILLDELKEELTQMLISDTVKECYLGLLDAYVFNESELKLGERNILNSFTNTIKLLNNICTHSLSKKVIEICMNSICSIIQYVKPEQLSENFELLKLAFSTITRAVTRVHIERVFFNKWKVDILEKLRCHPNKSFFVQIKELINVNDEFIIIPSVWSLNPEKLTERQRERFAEKSVISALYNDVSQSQEATIKPWTPKKIVIAKGMEREIAIEGNELVNAQTDPNTDAQCSENTLNFSQIMDLTVTNCKNASKIHKESNNFQTNANMNTNKTAESTKVNKDQCNVPCEENPQVYDIQCDMQASLQKPNEEDNLNTSSVGSPKRTVTSQPMRINGMNTPLHKIRLTYKADTSAHKNSSSLCNGVTKLSNQEEMKTSIKPTQKEIVCTTSDLDVLSTINETIQPSSELSPKKDVAKFMPLLSPPDRKFTNNNCSPTLRPKPSAHLTGRGAQLINMIRKKNIIGGCQGATNSTNTEQRGFNSRNTPTNIATTPSDIYDFTASEQIATELQPNDLLMFSKRMPSLTASPTASILKRKLRHDSIEEASIETPASKRKRVSFHDPPVSITKQFLTELDDIKTKRCLLMDRMEIINGSQMKHMLKHKTKTKLDVEMKKVNEELEENASNAMLHAWAPPSQLKTNEKTCSLQSNPVNKECLEEQDMDSALDLVVQNCSLDVILKKYLAKANENELNSKSSNVLAKFISNYMAKSAKMKKTILDTLSEDYSTEFLDYAIQENQSSVVCDRLNINSIINYVCLKSKQNTSCRDELIIKISELIKEIKLGSENLNFVKTILQTIDSSDENILDLVTQLMNMRKINIGNRNKID